MNSVGYSDNSPALLARAADQPDAPINLTRVDSDTSTSSFGLSWSAPVDNGGADLSYYTVYWKKSTDGDYTDSFQTADATVVSHVVNTGIISGTFYNIKVQAFNEVGGSSDSNVLTIVAAVAPDAPATPTVSSQSSSAIEISWLEPTNNGGTPVTGYTISFKQEQDSTYVQIGQTSSATTILQVNGSDITAGQAYNFIVRAINAAGTGDNSSALRVMAADVPGTPDTPTKISASQTEIKVGWTAPTSSGNASITGYKLYWNGGSGSLLSTELYDSASDSVFEYTTLANALTSGGRYLFAVAAYNEIGTGPQSSTIEIIAAVVPVAPDAPTRFASGLNSISIQWTAPSSDGDNAITGYTVEWNGGSGSTFVTLGTTGAATFIYAQEGLNNGQVYTFRVKAFNEIGSSDASTSVALRSAVAPDAPGTPLKTYADKTQINISWTAPSSDGGATISDYEVYMDDGAGGSFASQGKTGSGSTLTFNKTGLTTGLSYLFKVRAENEIDSGPFSSPTSILAAVIPSTPDAPLMVSQSESVIAISWSAPSDDGGTSLIGYKIQWNAGTGSVFSTIHNHSDLNDLTFTKSDNIQAGKTYEFRIVAINTVGDSLESASLGILAAAVPNEPLNLVKESSTKTSITFNWDIPSHDGSSNIVGYRIYWDNNSGTVDESTSIGDTTWQTLSFFQSGLTTGATYKFAVKAYNIIGESIASTSVSIIAAVQPGAPSTPTLNNQSKTQVSINWDDPLDDGGSVITNYIVQMAVGASPSSSDFSTIATIANAVGSDTYETQTGTTPLVTGNIYTFRVYAVSAVDTSLASSNSPQIMAAILPDTPGIPTRKSTTSETQVSIQWTAPADDGGDPIDDYQVYWDAGNGGSYTLLGSSSNQLEYTVDATSGGLYKFKVNAVNYIGDGPLSAIGQVYAATVPDTPAAPTLVTATKTQIQIQVVAPNAGGNGILISGYKFLMNGGGSSSVFTDVTSTGSFDSVTLVFTTADTLTTGTSYKFQVKATTVVGDSAASIDSVSMYAAIIPTEPLNLAKQSANTASIETQWDEPTDTGGTPITSYLVYSNGGGTSTTFALIGTVLASSAREFSHDTSAVTAGTTFKYKVKAVNVVGEGPLTAEIEIISATVPVQPAAPTKASASKTSIAVNWVIPASGGSAITGFTLQMNGGTGDATFIDIATITDPSTTSYTKSSGLTTGEAYSFKLIATNAVGSSLTSDASDPITASDVPDQPGTPTYLSSDATSVAFQWTAPTQTGGSDLTGYQILWNEGSGSTAAYVQLDTISGTTTLSYSYATGLTTGTRYRFKVIAVNGVGPGTASAYLEIMPAALPGSPNQPTVTASSSTSITIAWTAGTDGGTSITDYKVYWDQGISGQVLVASLSTGNLLTFTTTDISASSTYNFWVSAQNFVGEGPSSTSTSVLAASVPDAPVVPTVTGTYNTVSLTWVQPDGRGGEPIDNYEIYWDSDGNASDNFQQLAQTSNTYYAITTGIVQGTNYKFKVLANNQVGWSAESPIGSAVAASEPAQPDSVTKLTADTTSITVQWTQPDSRGSAISNYLVYWDQGAAVEPRTLLTTTSSTTFSASSTLSLADLTDGQTYRFTVVAQNSIGDSPYADQTSIIAATVPTAPTIPTVVSANQSNIMIQWDQPASGGSTITNYIVYSAVGTSPTSGQFSEAEDTVLDQTYTKFDGFTSGETTYNFKVLARNSVGDSTFSPVIQVIAATVPDAPTNLATVSQSTTSITFSWEAANNNGGSTITDFSVYWNGGSGTSYTLKIASTGASTTQATLTGADISSGTLYSFKVTATNAAGESIQSTKLDIYAASSPDAPGTPFRVDQSTNASQIVVGWTAPASTGGIALLEYQLWWNQGPQQDTMILYEVIDSSTLQKIVTGVSSGTPYIFKLLARNDVGVSVFSSEVTIYAAEKPSAPAAPTRVANTHALNTIDIEWTPNSDGGSTITGYEIWWNGGGSGPVTGLKDTLSTDAVTYQATGLSSGTYYSFAIASVNVVGTSPLSSETSLISAMISDAPTVLALVSQSEALIKLSWTAPASNGGTTLTAYKLYWDQQGDSNAMALLTSAISPSVTEYSITSSDGLVSGESYDFLIVAANVVGDSANSNTLSSIIAATQPTAPQNLRRYTAGTLAATTITLNWDAPASNGGSAITTYSLYWNQGTDASATTLISTVTTLFESKTGLTSGSSYKFAVLATNSVSDGPLTSDLTLIAAQAPGATTKPTRNDFTGETSMTLGWDAPTDDGGSPLTLDYEIHWNAGTNNGYSQLVASTSGARTYLVTGLTTATTYSFKILAKNEVGSSALSENSNFQAAAVPSAPSNLALVSQSTEQIKFQWNAPSSNGGIDLIEYEIYYNGGSGTVFTLTGTRPDGQLLFTQSSLSAGTTYAFYVKATNAVGSSEASSEISIMAATIPNAPQDLAVSTQSQTSITIQWTAVGAGSNGGDTVSDYKVWWNQGAFTNVYVELATSTGNLVTYTTSSGLSAGQAYDFKVLAVNSIGDGAQSDALSVIAASVPDAPTSLLRDEAGTDRTQVTFTWTIPPSDGGSSIIDYQVWWDKGLNDFELLQSNVAAQTFTQSAGVSDGSYQFQVKAQNAVGYSVLSDILTIIAAKVPDTPATPSTQVNGANILVQWVKPESNGNDLTSYTVYLKKSDNSWALDLVNCDGGSLSGMANPSCAIPITTLEASPFSLTSGDSVLAKVIATNEVGDSGTSSEGNGAQIP